MYMNGSTLYFQGSQHKTMHYVVLTDTCTCTCTCSTMPSSVHVHYSDNINHCEQFPVTTKHYLNVLCFHTRVCRMVRTNSLPAQEALLLNHHFEVLLAVFGECLLTDIQLERQRTPVCILLLNQHHDLVLIQPAAHWLGAIVHTVLPGLHSDRRQRIQRAALCSAIRNHKASEREGSWSTLFG